MLGRLLQNATTIAYSKGPKLESTTDEISTRSLLFHENGSIMSRLSEFDDTGGLLLDLNKDFRVIIAQDALGEQDDPCILLDSREDSSHGREEARKPDVRGQDAGQTGLRRTAQSPQTSSLPKSRSAVTVFNPRNRASTMSNPPAGLTNQVADTKDSNKVFLGCMFGSSSASKSGPSTKMHVISANDASTITSSVQIPRSTRSGNPASPGTARKRDPLLRAHTYGTQGASHPGLGSIPETNFTRDTILVTRMFNVNLPEPADLNSFDALFTTTRSEDPSPEYPFPAIPSANPEEKQKRKLREKKTPAFAVSLLVDLPRRFATSRPPSRRGLSSPKLGSGQSPTSSLGSDSQSSWAFLDAMPYSISSSQALVDIIDRRIEHLVDHWDVITRALSVLERQASRRLLELLNEADHALTLPRPKQVKDKATQRTNQVTILLHPMALANCEELRASSLQAIKRVANALRIPRAMTGTGSFTSGPWVEEARYMARFCGAREHNFFLFNLLTAFLGNHTGWLSLLGPEWYRERHRQMQLHSRQDAETIVSRTVIVCNGRSVGRRLVFLLASFLPGPALVEASSSPHMPVSSGGFRQPSSQSPPIGSRKQSLRRSVNTRARENRLAAEKSGGEVLSTSFSSADGEPADLAFARQMIHRRLQPKGSESESSNATAMLTIPSNDSAFRKTSSNTTSMVTLDAATPTAHFSSGSTKVDSYFPADMMHDKTASKELARHLRQSSTDTSFRSEQSPGSTKWASLLSGVSGMCSARPEISSATTASPEVRPAERLGSRQHTVQTTRQRPVSRNKLEDMVEEIRNSDSNTFNDSRFTKQEEVSTPVSMPSTKSTLVPLNMSANSKEGVVDIDIHIPGFLSSSLDSGPRSPQPFMPGPHPSTTSLDGYASMHSSASIAYRAQDESCNQSNVAGYLQNFHPDFVVQAVKPYRGLEHDIRTSMLAEPTTIHAPLCTTPPYDDRSRGTWVDVCTTLIADLATFTVRRIRLRRLQRPLTHAVSPVDTSETSVKTTSNKFSLDEKEEFIVEDVMDLDATLTDAIERMLSSRSGQPSRMPSPSRLAHSRNVSTSTTTSSVQPTQSSHDRKVAQDTATPPVDFAPQRSRKLVVDALEEIVKNVNDDLNNNVNGRDIQGAKARENPPKAPKHEESALRDGVKKWLVNVEQTAVW